ncbi:AraC family transcriptional regulator [Paucilactobacillus oligofermentans DSM 15707 = LMG 22743]|uniref:AraC family transcriptional regulator n=1 Tax=Paucilactobacillus oligofermentans TaxID=293371 RepID=UPI00070E1CF6|nr:AraC family transcriptional regulator [Paucilactobacillus oligofermentans]CUS27060.1 AraC family transcriptional regulator [Paucilactobacillus oligofermentans DSM 15707 = LMG 22743]
MRYSFGIIDYSLPLYADSVSNEWNQENVNRDLGYPFVHWLQTISGAGVIQIDGKLIELSTGQGILIDKDIPHSYKSKSSDWNTAYFTFGGELISEMLDSLKFKKYIHISNPNCQLLQFVDNYYENVKANKIDEYESSVLVYKFLLLIKKNQVSNNIDPKAQEFIIEPIINLIEKQYMLDLKNDDFVRVTNYSLQYILEIFRENLSSSPHKILINYRVKKAKELLINQANMSVEEIGQRVGFNTNSYFISTFKKKEKVTPNRFRQYF